MLLLLLLRQPDWDGHLFVEHIDHFLSEEELRDYLEREEEEGV